MGLIDNALGTVKEFIAENPLASIGGAAALGVGAGLGASAIAKSIGNNVGSSKRTGRRIKHTKRGWKQDGKRRSKQKWEVAYQRRKRRLRKSLRRKHVKHSRSRRGIHYTKNGQPYKILSNGRARFIKKRR